jgi:hypothetical protein
VRFGFGVLAAFAACAAMLPAQAPPALSEVEGPRKHLLAWADVQNGYQHDS